MSQQEHALITGLLLDEITKKFDPNFDKYKERRQMVAAVKNLAAINRPGELFLPDRARAEQAKRRQCKINQRLKS